MHLQTKRRVLNAGIIIGSLLLLSPFVGLLGTVIGMTRAFRTLADSGVADPRALSHEVSQTLFSTASGLFLFVLGAAILTVSLLCRAQLPASPPPLPPKAGSSGRPPA